MLDLAAGTPSSPGMYGTGEDPAVVAEAVRSDIGFLRCPGGAGRLVWCEEVSGTGPEPDHCATLVADARASARKGLDAPDRRGIVLEKARRDQPRHQLEPASVAAEHAAEEGSRLLLPLELPEGCRLPEEQLVVSGREPGRLRVRPQRLLDFPLGDEGVPLVALPVCAPER